MLGGLPFVVIVTGVAAVRGNLAVAALGFVGEFTVLGVYLLGTWGRRCRLERAAAGNLAVVLADQHPVSLHADLP